MSITYKKTNKKCPNCNIRLNHTTVKDMFICPHCGDEYIKKGGSLKYNDTITHEKFRIMNHGDKHDKTMDDVDELQ